MKTGTHSLAPLGIGALALPAFAFQPLVTDDTGTQGERGNQVEFSIDSERANEAGQTTRTRTLPFTFTPTLVRRSESDKPLTTEQLVAKKFAATELGMLLPDMKVNFRPDDYYPIRQARLASFDGKSWKPMAELITIERL